MKDIAIYFTNILGSVFYFFYRQSVRFSLLRELLYGQKIKRSLFLPFPSVMFAVKPVTLIGHRNIKVGNYVKIGQYSTISAWTLDKQKKEPLIDIGNNVVIGSFDHITAINSIVIEDGVLLGKYVTITDNSHGMNSKEEMNILPIKRKLFSKGMVRIQKNVWIGDKVTILPNVTIGEGAIIGANSVVTRSIPAFCIACGNPAKVIKVIN